MLETLLPAEALGFLLVFSRLGALFFVAPALGEQMIPARVRLALALSVSFLVFLLVRGQLPEVPASPVMLAGMVIREVLIGLMIAAAARLLISALNVAGTVFAMQTGLGIAQQYDPGQGAQTAITAGFLTMLGVVLIFVSDLHLLMLEAVVDSYALFPVGRGVPVADFAELVVNLVAVSFTLGVQIAAPFLVFGIVFNVGLGLIARLMPQLPVFFVALPASIFLGFVVLLIALPAMMMWFLNAFEQQLSVFLQ